jgi:hypothetical protein
MEPKLKLSKDSSSHLVDATMYMSVVGSLRYLVNTRPDLAFLVGYVSRFMQEPHSEHLAAMKHILRYVARTCGLRLFFPRETEGYSVIRGYSDSDLTGDVDARKSTTGMIYFLGRSHVSW